MPPIRQAAFQGQESNAGGPSLSTRSEGVITLAPPEEGETEDEGEEDGPGQP